MSEPTNTPPVLIEGKKVQILLPWYKEVHPITAWSVMRLVDRTRVSVRARWGDAFIIHTRCVLADEFLKSGVEWSLWIDGDMAIPCGDAAWYNGFTRANLPKEFAGLNSLDRLLSHNKTFVCGMYWGRYPRSKPIYAEAMNSEQEDRWARKGPYDMIKQTRWSGFGCALVHRSVFLDIEKKYPHLARSPGIETGGQWFTPSESDLRRSFEDVEKLLSDASIPENVRVIKSLSLIDAANRKMEKLSPIARGEDVAFAERALQAGHPCYVDCGLHCSHIGEMIYNNRT